MSELFDRIVARDAEWKKEIINTETWPLADRRWLIGRVREMEAAIVEHNKGVIASCVSNATLRGCDSYTKRGRVCPDCPKEWLLDLPAFAPETKGEQSEV